MGCSLLHRVTRRPHPAVLNWINFVCSTLTQGILIRNGAFEHVIRVPRKLSIQILRTWIFGIRTAGTFRTWWWFWWWRLFLLFSTFLLLGLLVTLAFLALRSLSILTFALHSLEKLSAHNIFTVLLSFLIPNQVLFGLLRSRGPGWRPDSKVLCGLHLLKRAVVSLFEFHCHHDK